MERPKYSQAFRSNVEEFYLVLNRNQDPYYVNNCRKESPLCHEFGTEMPLEEVLERLREDAQRDVWNIIRGREVEALRRAYVEARKKVKKEGYQL